MFTHVLFDLDGTLTDSKEGIIKSVAYGLEQIGETTEGRLEQHVVVGPPLMTTFMDVYGFSEEKSKKLYSLFQERYSTVGRFENKPFPGILSLLKALQEQGVKSYVATSKPVVHARAICDKFGIAPYMEYIAGGQVGGTETKADIIEDVLRRMGPVPKDNILMVGDRKYDVIGAREKGLSVAVVTFGYGSEEERMAYPPDYVATDTDELLHIILDQK